MQTATSTASASTISRPSRESLLIAALLIVLSVGVFWPGLAGDFVYDDLIDIRNVDAVFAPGGWTQLLTTASAQLFRPFKYLSYYLDNQWFGWHPRGWHWQSLLWHALNSVLVFALARRLRTSPPGAFIAAALFAVHPIHTEAVVWISSRASLQSTTGVLIMLIGYDRWREKPSRDALALALAGGVIGFFSKEDALMIFPILGAYEWFWRRANPLDLPRNKAARGILAPLALMAAAYVVLRQSILSGLAQGRNQHGFSGWLATEPVILATYLRQLFWPDPMCIDQPVDYTAGFGAAFFISVLILLALGAFLLIRRPAWGPWQFALAFFFISLIPVMGIIPINQARADRFLYLPSVGAALALGWLADLALRSPRLPRILLASAFAAAAALAGWRSWDYSKTFLNERAIWERVMTINPQSYRAYANLAALDNNAGKFDDALRQIERALQIWPEYPEGRVIKAYALQHLNRPEDAEALYRAALQSVPDEPRWLFLLADLLQTEGQLAQAEECFDRIAALRPGYVEARLSAGALAITMKKPAQARAHWEAVLKYDPTNEAAQHNLKVLERLSP